MSIYFNFHTLLYCVYHNSGFERILIEGIFASYVSDLPSGTSALNQGSQPGIRDH